MNIEKALEIVRACKVPHHLRPRRLDPPKVKPKSAVKLRQRSRAAELRPKSEAKMPPQEQQKDVKRFWEKNGFVCLETGNCITLVGHIDKPKLRYQYWPRWVDGIVELKYVLGKVRSDKVYWDHSSMGRCAHCGLIGGHHKIRNFMWNGDIVRRYEGSDGFKEAKLDNWWCAPCFRKHALPCLREIRNREKAEADRLEQWFIQNRQDKKELAAMVRNLKALRSILHAPKDKQASLAADHIGRELGRPDSITHKRP